MESLASASLANPVTPTESPILADSLIVLALASLSVTALTSNSLASLILISNVSLDVLPSSLVAVTSILAADSFSKSSALGSLT